MENKKEISELYILKHIHDKEPLSRIDFENKLFSANMPNVIFFNEKMSEFIDYLTEIHKNMFMGILYVRNYYNYTVDKYYDKYLN